MDLGTGDLILCPSWECAARKANMGANEPQECNWPLCGCDPYADKVIAALQEHGIFPDPRPPRAPKTDAELAGELAGYVLGKAEDHLGLRGCEIDVDQETYHMEQMLAELRREFRVPLRGE